MSKRTVGLARTRTVTRKHADGAERIIAAAELHGQNSDDPDHEVGDLQGALYACWNVMTDTQRAKVLRDPHVRDALLEWEETVADVIAEPRLCYCGERDTCLACQRAERLLEEKTVGEKERT